MFVQECIKGITGIDRSTAQEMTEGGLGIRCNKWRNNGSRPDPAATRSLLTYNNLDRHLHDYDGFGDDTPFISLSAGTIDRQSALMTNVVHSAEETAALFATNFGIDDGYLFRCWVIISLNPAVSIEQVSEEIREVHTYTRFSPYLLEGEVTAKIHIPANQIESFQYCRSLSGSSGVRFEFGERVLNSIYDLPSALENRRRAL